MIFQRRIVLIFTLDNLWYTQHTHVIQFQFTLKMKSFEQGFLLKTSRKMFMTRNDLFRMLLFLCIRKK